jgi:GntR family transcriptional repressor for pyruvate dehydrogenase complex
VDEINESRRRRASGALVPMRRVRKAYEQVGDQLREVIMSGELAPGQRLPSEAALALQFGVSRATIREALRVLLTQNLIRTTKGAHGGSFVNLPTIDHISEFLRSNISLLSRTDDVSLDDLLEARELLEVPAARLAARRHTAEHVEELRAAIPDDPLRLGTAQHFLHNRDFHYVLVEASGNALLSISAQPVFSVLQTNLKRSVLGRKDRQAIQDDHRDLLAAIQARDEDAAAECMKRHLAFLRPVYEKAWRTTRRSAEPAAGSRPARMRRKSEASDGAD